MSIHLGQGPLLSLRDVSNDSAPEQSADGRAPTIDELAGWVKNYLMRPHVALGRDGDVCPYTAQAARLDTIRLGWCEARPEELARINSYMTSCFKLFEEIPCPKTMRHFRTIIVGFPNCNSEAGLAGLRQAQRALRRHTLLRPRMLGFFHSGANEKGLRNPAFRPMRAPFSIFAIREMVEYDAPFIARSPLAMPVYLARFKLTGVRRIIDEFFIREGGARAR
jgi:hypothetical protein